MGVAGTDEEKSARERVSAILLAGGSGSRMRAEVPKQWLRLGGKELIRYALETLQEDAGIDEIVLVTLPEDVERMREELVERYGYTKVKRVCAGGAQRYDSVERGLAAVRELAAEKGEPSAEKGELSADTKEPSTDTGEPSARAPIVLIHDGARPFLTHRMIAESLRCIRAGYDACTVGVPVKDTILRAAVRDGRRISRETLPREELFTVQTPQTFRLPLLWKAYARLRESGDTDVTDDTMIAARYAGVAAVLLDGAYENIKLTTPEDIAVAECILTRWSADEVG